MAIVHPIRGKKTILMAIDLAALTNNKTYGKVVEGLYLINIDSTKEGYSIKINQRLLNQESGLSAQRNSTGNAQ